MHKTRAASKMELLLFLRRSAAKHELTLITLIYTNFFYIGKNNKHINSANTSNMLPSLASDLREVFFLDGFFLLFL